MRIFTPFMASSMTFLFLTSASAENVITMPPPVPAVTPQGVTPAASEADVSLGSNIILKIGDAQTKKSPLALPDLVNLGVAGAGAKTTGDQLFRTIEDDLTTSNYFEYVKKGAYQGLPMTSLKPVTQDPAGFKFEPWQEILGKGERGFLIRGGYTISGQSIALEVYVYEISKGALAFGKRYKGDLSTLTRMGHTFCNDLLETLTGKRGMFLSKFVFTSDRGGGKYREVWTMDWNGDNVEKISNHKSIAVSPAWSADGKRIAYTDFVEKKRTKERNPDLFIYETQTKKRWLVSYRQGLNSGANFDPDNKDLYLTISKKQTPDIYKMNFDGEILERLTDGPARAMNVEPAVSPDGTRLAFSSDRSGRPMIFVMDLATKKVTQKTFDGTFNASPAWSPDSKTLAYSFWDKNPGKKAYDHFEIVTIDATGEGKEKKWTTVTTANRPDGKPATHEDPCFSPDGRFLVYSSNKSGSSQIYISTLDGSYERRITHDDFNYFKPKWSNNLD